MKRILVCEDEAAIREFVVFNLKRDGFTVLEADDGETALRLYAQEDLIDIALLDVMLPDVDGFTICRQLRAADPTLGIVMLTARSQESEKVEGLNSGADDYITKPFGTAELIARLDALYRRVQILRRREQDMPTAVLKRGRFVLNLRNRSLERDGVPIELTQIEYQIVECLFCRQNECCTREEILHRVWGEQYVGDDKIVDVNIRRLRMKMEEDPSAPRHLVTVRGTGYAWHDG